ncbi:MAG TPA: hypothetical protein IAA88_01385 [Candidatus Avimuribaculum pullicola]|nr:hypothetical protein [Candidatus Avimuribaculum pullicola]
MLSIDDIRDLVENGAAGHAVSREKLDAARQQFPYFVVPSILYMQRNCDSITDEEKKEILPALALAFPDRTVLYSLVGNDADRFAQFYPQQEAKPTPDTDTTIDTFLDRYGHSDDKEMELLDRLIFNPVPDYSQVLAEEQQPTDDSTEEDPLARAASAFDNIVARTKPVPPQPAEQQTEPVKEPEPAADDSMLSESLAKIFIKQGKYAKALEIIKNISLKFPEKSIYFADQIRFLQKLILNEEINNR